MDYVVRLDSPRAVPEAAGAKAARLGLLLRAGSPVPPGFVVTTGAYLELVSHGELAARIDQATRCDLETPSAAVAAEGVRESFARLAVPEAIAAAIVGAYRRLASSLQAGDERTLPVAVRSSATLEDSPSSSFAGQHDSFLNVRGEQALLEAVRACWASFWSPRALVYRQRSSLGWPAQGMAVLVQQLIPAQAAGVLYTVDPISRDVTRVVINAAWGLGVAVVDGAVEADTVIADKPSGRVLSMSVGDKRQQTSACEGGTRQVAVDPLTRVQAVLDAELVAALVRQGRAAEAELGAPQDLEWAIHDRVVYLLQSRPLTAGAAPAAPADDPWPAVGQKPAQPFDLWTQVNVGEVWPQPVTPLTWSGIPEIVGAGVRYALRGLGGAYLADVQWAKRFFGHIYYNEGALSYVLSHELGLPGGYVGRGLGSMSTAVMPAAISRVRVGRLLSRLPYFLSSALRQSAAQRRLQALFAETDAQVREFQELRLEKWPEPALWDLHRRWLERLLHVMARFTEASGASLTVCSLLEALGTRWCGDGTAQQLLGGLSGVLAAEMGAGLESVAREIERAGLADRLVALPPATALAELYTTPAGSAASAELDRFLARFGHRCLNEGEWLNPRWAEAPEAALDLALGYLRAGGATGDRPQEAQRRRDCALADIRHRLGPVRRAILLGVLARAQRLVRLRDNGKHYYMKTAFPLRRIHATLGRRWHQRGWLAAADDIFFLGAPEIERIIGAGEPGLAGLEPAAIVASRRAAYESWFAIAAPEVVGPDGTPMTDGRAASADDPLLRGLPGSWGTASGPARVLHDLRDAPQVRRGDVLVTRAADPGWTVVFPLLAGLVVELGGQLSHAAIVAREYGLPAVVNVKDATRRIRDGQTVSVDGGRGHVHLHDRGDR